jgi:hypothetical protein
MKLKVVVNNLSTRDKEVEQIANMLLKKYKEKPMVNLPKQSLANKKTTR